MKIEEILTRKGREVVTITEEKSVLEAVQLLVAKGIGGLVVVEGQDPIGIITERDILRLTAESDGDLGSIRTGSVMTRDLITGKPGDQLAHVMDIMTENRIRHLPVTDDDGLVGIISIGDLVNAFRVSAEEENSHLRQYIQGTG